jgi:Xaa-Pro aminopeptidase
LASASATPVRPPTRRASPCPACRACASTSRSGRARRGRVEPGIYVVPALLSRERGRDGVDWDRVDELHGFGGVRLEQNVLITDDGCEVLTAAVPL